MWIVRYIIKIEGYLHGARMSEHKVPQLSISRLSHFATILYIYIYLYICVCVSISEYTCIHFISIYI